MEKREPSWVVGGNVNWYSHYGEQYGISPQITLACSTLALNTSAVWYFHSWGQLRFLWSGISWSWVPSLHPRSQGERYLTLSLLWFGYRTWGKISWFFLWYCSFVVLATKIIILNVCVCIFFGEYFITDLFQECLSHDALITPQCLPFVYVCVYLFSAFGRKKC